MKKYYAVLIGRGNVPTICTTWKECEEKVKGYPNAKYKSFENVKDAKQYIKKHTKTEDHEISLKAYVDGSYSKTRKKYSYGVIIIKNNKIISQQKGIGDNKDAAEMHQIYGELTAAIKAVEYAKEKKEKEIEICFDYQGIESWATGEWKAKNPYTKKYAEFMHDAQKKTKISFRKIKAHTGDKYNEIADSLAKDALKIQ